MNNYHLYGGRGIRVLEPWRSSFLSFFRDMGYRPSPDHSLDRIDVDGHYCPGNVRWATKKEQARNTRTNVVLTWRGRTMCVTEWAELTGIKRRIIYERLAAGIPLDITLTQQRLPRGGDRRSAAARLARAT